MKKTNIKKANGLYLLTIIDHLGKEVVTKIAWAEMAILFCKVSKEVCKYINKGKKDKK